MISSEHMPMTPTNSVRRDMRVALVTEMFGSLHRFHLLRRFLDRAPGVSCLWIPIYGWREADPLRFLPGFMLRKVRTFFEAKVAFADRTLDAVIFHAHGSYILFAWWSLIFRRRTLTVWYRDDPPYWILDMAIAASNDAREIASYKDPLGIKNALAATLYRATFAVTDLIVCRCEYTKRFLVERCRVPAERIHVLHVGIDLDYWPQRDRPVRPRDRCVKLLFVASDFWRKGGDILVQVFQEHFVDECELHIVSSQQNIEELLQDSTTLSGNNLHIHRGLQADSEELRQLYYTSDIFVFPTRFDLAPFAVIEAMAANLPVISTHVGGMQDLVEDNATGVLIESGDVVALRNAIRLMIDNPELCNDFGRRGRSRVESDFNAQKNVEELLKLVRGAVMKHEE